MRNSRERIPIRLARGVEKELLLVGVPLGAAIICLVRWPGPWTVSLAGILLALFALLLAFFRDPRRVSPSSEGVFLAPADGQIVEVGHVLEPRYLGQEGLKISIFMSLLDVHVNRSPSRGELELVQHVPGQHRPAFQDEASEMNEHNLLGLKTPYGRVLVKQVAGIMARRIVCWVKSGQNLQAGDRIGVIKFGSRVDLFLPLGSEATVQVGDCTRAGITVVALWKGGTDS